MDGLLVSLSNHTSDLKLVLCWLPCQMPGTIGLEPRLGGPVLVYCRDGSYSSGYSSVGKPQGPQTSSRQTHGSSSAFTSQAIPVI